MSHSIDNSGKTLLNGTLTRRDIVRSNFAATAHPLSKRRNTLATTVEAPMVGKILKIEKQVGEHVDEDEVVIVMEAMKMEIPIVAPVAGTLKELKVAPGEAVEAEQALAIIE
jgi:biotin carboxyl carrier protein